MEAQLDHKISMVHPLGTMNARAKRSAFSETEDFEISSEQVKLADKNKQQNGAKILRFWLYLVFICSQVDSSPQLCVKIAQSG